MDTDSFIVYIKTDDIYKNIGEDVETRFDTPNCELERPLLKGLMKDELGGKIIIRFVGLKAKIYSYLIDHGKEDKRAKGTKKCVIKGRLKFENYKNCFEANELDNEINYLEKYEINVDSLKKDHKEFIKNNELLLKKQQRFKSETHNVIPKKIKKIALYSNDDKRMQSIDSIGTYAYGASKDLVSKKEDIKLNNIIKWYKSD